MEYRSSDRPWRISVDNEASVDSGLRRVGDGTWSGVVSRHTTASLVRACAELKLPLVDLNDAFLQGGVHRIRPENRAIGQCGAHYFIERKFRHFGYCGEANQVSSSDRLHGFLDALCRAGHSCSVFEGENRGPTTDLELSALDGWLRSLPGGVGVMACDDRCAQRLIRAARRAGRHVPDQVAVLGANNELMRCESTEPSLSSVALDAIQTGRRAAEQLHRLMTGEEQGVADLRIEPLGVVSRKSTDVLALQDPSVAVAANYIWEFACEGATVHDVLSQVRISRSQLEQKFRRLIGRSPQSQIRWVQIEKAQQLLRGTDLPLSAISEIAGFTHVEYMSVVFKRLTGETPGYYRRRQGSEVPWGPM